MQDGHGTSNDGREQVLSLIDFLGAYDARRNPPVRDITQYKLLRLASDALPGHPQVTVHTADDAWLAVDFLDLPEAPPVPPAVAEFLLHGSDIVAIDEPALLPPPDRTDPRTSSQDEIDAAYERGTSAATAWIESIWRPWSEQWQRISAVKVLHRDLFEQRERLTVDRDTLELVWGFGRLRWDLDQDRVNHPMFTVPVEIDVNTDTQQIRVRPAGPPEVESRYLNSLDINDRAGFMAIRQAVTADGADIWVPEDMTDLLRRLIRSIDDEGTVVEKSGAAPGHATVDAGWVLYLRRRVPDSQGFLDQMRDLYAHDHPIPEPLRAIVAPSPDDEHSAHGDPEHGDNRTGTTEPLLLPLDSNEEQARILEYAQRYPGVVVQGPPGTGKSHTIANLISHHVAYGRRVLVVAEKEQSLKVLANKVPREIRDLIVSVLGADEEGRRRLETAIVNIQSGVAAIDPAYADRQIDRLTTELDTIDRQLAETRTAFLRARQAEVRTLSGDWFAGTTLTPQAAAAWLTTNPQFGIIPDRLTVTTAAPTDADLIEFLHLLAAIGIERAEQAVRHLPDPSTLPPLSSLRAAFADVERSGHSVDVARTRITDWHRATAAGLPPVQSALHFLTLEAEIRARIERSWWRELLQRLADPLQATEWRQFARDLGELRTQIMQLRPGVRAHDVSVLADNRDELRVQLSEAHQKLSSTGKLGLFAKDARRGLERCAVDGHVPATAAEVQLCLDALAIDALRRRVTVLWSNQTAGIGEPLPAGPAEETLVAPLAALEETLATPVRWHEISSSLVNLGIAAVGAPVPENIRSLQAALENLVVHLQTAGAADWIAQISASLATGGSSDNASPLWGQLQSDLAARDASSWQSHASEVASLREVAVPATRLFDLRSTFRAVAPVWTAQIVADPTTAGNPRDFQKAWQWAQLESWISDIAGEKTPKQLQDQLTELLAARKRTVTRLVTERAWRRLAANLGQRERQALTAYLKAARRYGKTGGKFAQRWINEMRVALDDAKTAVPVWIMPTAKALTSFRPSATPPFDVLIVDEASQIGFDAIPLLSLASTAIIVGDDKQTSPENVGLDRQQAYDLMDQFLVKLPGYRTLFDPDSSLYDMARERFSAPIVLREHFRCLPDIIAFSNRVAYDNAIIPLRDQAPKPGWSPLGLVRVLDGYRVSDVNEPEAQQVAALIGELCLDPDYDGMTCGVISLLGTAQSKRIWDLLYEQLGPETMQERKIRCGEAANFQGDERDVMVLSTVVARDTVGGKRIGSMTSERDLRRINVAASRAENQMWVVTSVDAADLGNGDLRAELIRHCSDAATAGEVTEDLLARCESDFERRVVSSLLARGYRGVEVQHIVGRYRIDIVVNGPDGRLAVECDGDRWHGEDVWHQDRARQEVLERAGWQFERIRGSAFYRDPVAAMQPVWDHLDRLGVPTGDEWQSTGRRMTVREVSGPVVTSAPVGPTRFGERPVVQVLEDLDLDPEPVIDDADAAFDLWPVFDADGPLPDSPPETPAADVPPDVFETGHDTEPDDLGSVLTVSETVKDWLRSQVFGPPGYKLRARPPTAPPVSVATEATAVPVSASPHATSGPATTATGAPAPYRSWTPNWLPSVGSGDAAGIRGGLVEIVAAEGPMYAGDAYSHYVRHTGGQRVGREIQRTLNQLVMQSLRKGDLARLKDSYPGIENYTLFAPGNPPVVIRERGPRTLYEIPRSEVSALVAHLGLSDANVSHVKRSVLDFYGITRLTANASTYLDECLKYSWTV